MMRTFLYLSVMHLSIFRIQGYPSRAGSCHSGNAIPNYSPHPDVSSGELAAAGINVFIGDDQLSPSEPYSLQYGETEMNVLSIQSSSGFAGFLMRGSSSTGLDAPDIVTALSSCDTVTQSVQTMSSCERLSPQASGLTHINNNMKTYVEANIANADIDVIYLEVTVMVNANKYYYSKFTVDFNDLHSGSPVIPMAQPPSCNPSPTRPPITLPSTSSSSVSYRELKDNGMTLILCSISILFISIYV